jgi:hypothetical protein
MKKFLIPIFSALTILVAATALPFVAYAQQTEREGETKYSEANVPCGTIDEQKRVLKLGSDGKPELVDGNPVYEMINAQQTITRADGTTYLILGDGVVDNPCQFTHIIVLANKIITGLIIGGVVIATLGFAYAGFLYITAMGASEKISHAHSIFTKTVWGFVFMLSAWLIVYTMEQIFLTDEAKSRSFLQERAP